MDAGVRVLLDECVPHDLRHDLAEFDVQTAQYAGLAGYSNGKLIDQADGRFDVIVTIDSGFSFQQNLAGRSVALIVLRVESSLLSDLRAAVPRLIMEINRAKPGTVCVVVPELGDEI